MKHVVFLGDGMADEPFAPLGGHTPLELARHRCMDFLASQGEFGLTRTVPSGMPAGSDTANLSVFGYDPKIYYSGRSPLEAASMGIPLAPEDVTYRCNLVTLSDADNIENAVMIDYSADDIFNEVPRAHRRDRLLALSLRQCTRAFATATVSCCAPPPRARSLRRRTISPESPWRAIFRKGRTARSCSR